jgi:predicted XRE-type DNA-binding protein
MDETMIEKGSGNVFADLGLPDPEERLAKAMLSRAIHQEIRRRGLTQSAAAEVMDCAQPDVSKVARGDVSGFSVERLFRFLNALGMDVRIAVRRTKEAAGHGHVLVEVG